MMALAMLPAFVMTLVILGMLWWESPSAFKLLTGIFAYYGVAATLISLGNKVEETR